MKKERVVYKKASEVIDCLRFMFPENAYAFLTEVGNSTGFECKRHADVIVMSLWPSRGLEIIGMEVKVNRSDWVKELSSPQKAEVIFEKCDRWYLVVGDEEIVKDGELPKGWGLMIPKKDGLRIDTIAIPRNPEPVPDRSFVAAILRQSCAQLTNDSRLKAEYRRGRKDGMEEGKKIFDATAEHIETGEFRKKVAEFEKASGVKILNSYYDGATLGDAVRRVLQGADGRIKERLNGLHSAALRIAQEIKDELSKEPM